MPQVLIAFDVTERQSEMRAELKNLGYLERSTSGILPAATLWKKNSTVAAARHDIEFVAIKLNIPLIRAVSVEFLEWDSLPGIPFT